MMMGGGGHSGSASPCAACKFLRRRCTPDCVFAPYFPPNQPRKFAEVHKVFGASNVSKLLSEVPEYQREDTVNSLVYEAEAMSRNPIYGCVADISFLQNQITRLQQDIDSAKDHLGRYPNPAASSSSSSRPPILPYAPPHGDGFNQGDPFSSNFGAGNNVLSGPPSYPFRPGGIRGFFPRPRP